MMQSNVKDLIRVLEKLDETSSVEYTHLLITPTYIEIPTLDGGHKCNMIANKLTITIEYTPKKETEELSMPGGVGIWMMKII